MATLEIKYRAIMLNREYSYGGPFRPVTISIHETRAEAEDAVWAHQNAHRGERSFGGAYVEPEHRVG